MKVYKDYQLDEYNEKLYSEVRESPFITGYIENLQSEKHKMYVFSKYRLESMIGNKYQLTVNGITNTIDMISNDTYSFSYKNRTYTVREQNGMIYMLYSLNFAIKTLETLIQAYHNKYIIRLKTVEFIEFVSKIKDSQREKESMEAMIKNPCITSDLKNKLKKKYLSKQFINTILNNAIVIEI